MDTIRTNDIKKGTRIRLRNGWYATMMDNMRRNIRLARVEGDVTEIGSIYAHDIMAVVYAHDIMAVVNDTNIVLNTVEHTKSQLRLRRSFESLLE